MTHRRAKSSNRLVNRILWVCFACVLPLGAGLVTATGPQPEAQFVSFLGGSNWEHARDVAIDREGNIVVVGGTASRDFPTTPGAIQRAFAEGGSDTGDAKDCDAFIAKVRPDGTLLWATLLGGPNYDRAYGVECAPDGSIVICGRAGPGFPVTTGSFQPAYGGSRSNPFYGSQNGFVAKLSGDGKKLVWSSYLGVGECSRDLAVDAKGDVYANLFWTLESPNIKPPQWMRQAFQGAYQPKPAGDLETGVAKITGDGKRVVWASWLGGSGRESGEASIRVTADGEATIAGQTQSADFPLAGKGQRLGAGGQMDAFVARFSADGKRLEMATVVGSRGDDWVTNTHSLAIGLDGSTYVAAATQGDGWPVSTGAFQSKHGGKGDVALFRVGRDGRWLGSTFFGGSEGENADGLTVDSKGRVIVTGETESAELAPRFGSNEAGTAGQDGFVAMFDPSLEKCLRSFRYGGPGRDRFRACEAGRDGLLAVVGASSGTAFPLVHAFQPVCAGGPSPNGENDAVIALFRLP